VPSNESLATGQAILQLRADGTRLEFKLIAANLDNVVAAHVHLGPEGVNGPVVAFLFEPTAPGGGRFAGVLGDGTITDADLVDPAGRSAPGALVAAIVAGDAYVNAHTNDGVAPAETGPGNLPAGEIRG